MTRRQCIIQTFILVLVLSALASTANAQIAGGGSAGLFQQALTWVTTNIVNGLIAACVLFAGGLLMFGRHTLGALAVAAIGILVIANYATIAGLFTGGG